MDYAATMYITWLSALIQLGTLTTFLVVILTVVRRHRPDAYGGLLAWVIFSFGTFLVTAVGRALAHAFLGMNAALIATAAFSAVCAVIQAFLFVRGIVAIAVPRKPDDLPATPLYR